jgi:hypothetical protein
VADKNLMTLLKSYFNSQIKDKKIKNKRKVIETRRFTTKRVFIGKGELKHVNNKVIITFYVYNTEAMFLWGKVVKGLGVLYYPKKNLEISINEDTLNREVKSKYAGLNMKEWLKIFKNKYVFETIINKRTKEKSNIILLHKRIPNFSDNQKLKIKTFINKIIENNIENNYTSSSSISFNLLKYLNKVKGIVTPLSYKSLNMQDCAKILKNYQNYLINIFTRNKKIEKKLEIISFNRPLTLKNGLKLATNEDINNKKIIKFNRPLSLKEYSDQFDYNSYTSSNLNYLVETKLINNKEKLSIINDNVLYSYKHIQFYVPLYLYMFNKAKFSRNLLIKLTPLLRNLYNKEVIFNIVNLKKMHLSSDIYTQAIALKLKNRDNKLYRVLKSSLRKVKLSDFRKIDEKKNKPNKDEFMDNKIRNSLINTMFTKDDVKDPLNNLLLRFFPSTENLKKSVIKYGFVKNYSISLKDYVLMYLKHIKIRGIRVEAKGRLTRRFTASRSVFKMKWKGGLKNVDSSFRGLSTIMLRGYVKSNAQYSFTSSKNRNGAFGVKGWVSNK